MMIDSGLPLWNFVDIVSSAAEYIDFVKFGWGTAVVTGNIDAKIDVLRQHDIGFYFGGTLFEKFVLQDRLDDFRKFCAGHRCQHVEVSNGTISLTNTEKASYIRKLADDFTVISEVGFKDPPRSAELPPSAWIDCIGEDLAAGASLVTLEARESGRSGICRPDGTLRSGLIEDVLAAGHRPGAPAVRGPDHRPAGALHHQAGPGREPRQHPGLRRPRPGDPAPRAAGRHADRLRIKTRENHANDQRRFPPGHTRA